VLLGIASNKTLEEMELNLSGNGLGYGGGPVLEACLPTIANVSTLDLSDNGQLTLNRVAQKTTVSHTRCHNTIAYNFIIC